MAFLDDIALGARPPEVITKSGVAMAAVNVRRAYNLRYAAGRPGASTAPTIGINGEAVTPALNSPANVIGSRIPRTNPGVGLQARLNRFGLQVSQPGMIWIIDRLWQNSGLVVTSTGAQAITPAALPSRDMNGAALGAGVMAGIEWSTVAGAGAPTVTLTYTDQDGNTGNSATMTGVAAAPVGTMEIFDLAAGDTGIRAPTSFIQSATRTSGVMHLVLFRLVAQLEIPALGFGGSNSIDALTSGIGEIFDDSVHELLFFPSTTTAATFTGSYSESHITV